MSRKQAVLITGGAKRVGAVLCEYFAERGYDIALHYSTSQKQARALQAKIKKRGVACEIFCHDLRDAPGLPSLMRQVKKSMPHCIALINNASIFERAKLMETDIALFDRQVAVNFKAPFFLTRAFAGAFGKGAVVNIMDTDIVKTQGSNFIYLQSKKMLADFTQMAARELGPKIRVNGVCPGTMLPSEGFDAAYIKRFAQRLPLKKTAIPLDVAGAALWLCESPALTGQLIFVDGGQHLLD